LLADRHGNMTAADGTVKPTPITAALKPCGHGRSTLGTFRVGVTVIRCFLFCYESALWH